MKYVIDYSYILLVNVKGYSAIRVDHVNPVVLVPCLPRGSLPETCTILAFCPLSLKRDVLIDFKTDLYINVMQSSN